MMNKKSILIFCLISGIIWFIVQMFFIDLIRVSIYGYNESPIHKSELKGVFSIEKLNQINVKSSLVDSRGSQFMSLGSDSSVFYVIDFPTLMTDLSQVQMRDGDVEEKQIDVYSSISFDSNYEFRVNSEYDSVNIDLVILEDGGLIDSVKHSNYLVYGLYFKELSITSENEKSSLVITSPSPKINCNLFIHLDKGKLTFVLYANESMRSVNLDEFISWFAA